MILETQNSESGFGSGCADDVEVVRSAIRSMLGQKNYPCVPALKSFETGDYSIAVYECEFGSGAKAETLHADLLRFKEKQRESLSPYSTFWAVFASPLALTEEDFEQRLWAEVSGAISFEPNDQLWDPLFSSDPADENFCPSFGGSAFFLVGLHSQSSRVARRFQYPTIVFNLYDQFEELERQGRYETTVRANRAREKKFSNSLNPMVLKYGDRWEAIQFSGKENSAEWRCPFRHEVGQKSASAETIGE